MNPTTAALAMVDLFASVGAKAFSITHTNLEGEKRGFRPMQSLADTCRSMPYLIRNAPARQNNIILRPEPHTRFIQLDDLTADRLEQVRPAAFMILATSPNNFQAWVAVEDLAAEEHKAFAARVRRGAGADLTASGATRVAGSFNFKPKYAPAFPTVTVIEAAAGRMITKDELERLGLVAPADQPRPAPRRASHSTAPSPRKWPSYERCLQGAPAAGHGEADRSRADFTFCLTALDWGFSEDATAAKLIEVSERAQSRGRAAESYARETVTNAAAALAQRSQPARLKSTPAAKI
jgi:hypothetical protein